MVPDSSERPIEWVWVQKVTRHTELRKPKVFNRRKAPASNKKNALPVKKR